MSQSLKAMIVVAALVVIGVAANQFSRSQARAVGSSCRYGSSDRRRLCYSQLLSDHLDTRVRVDMSGRKGRVVVEFATLEDLERIYRAMTGADH